MEGIFGVVTSKEILIEKRKFGNSTVRFSLNEIGNKYQIEEFRKSRLQLLEKFIDYSEKTNEEIFVQTKKDTKNVLQIFFANIYTVQDFDQKSRAVKFFECPAFFSILENVDFNWQENDSVKLAYDSNFRIVLAIVGPDPPKSTIKEDCAEAESKLKPKIPDIKTLKLITEEVRKRTCNELNCTDPQSINIYDLKDGCYVRADLVREIVGSFADSSIKSYGKGFASKKIYVKPRNHGKLCVNQKVIKEECMWGDHIAVMVEVEEEGQFILDPGLCDSYITLNDWKNLFENVKNLIFTCREAKYHGGSDLQYCTFEIINNLNLILTYKRQINYFYNLNNLYMIDLTQDLKDLVAANSSDYFYLTILERQDADFYYTKCRNDGSIKIAKSRVKGNPQQINDKEYLFQLNGDDKGWAYAISYTEEASQHHQSVSHIIKSGDNGQIMKSDAEVAFTLY